MYLEFLFIGNDLFEIHFEYFDCILDFHYSLINFDYFNDKFSFLFESVYSDFYINEYCYLLILNSNLKELVDFQYQIQYFEQVVYVFFFN